MSAPEPASTVREGVAPKPATTPATTRAADWPAVLELHLDQLAAIALLHAASPAEAEDLVQASLCAAIGQRRVPDDPIAYLARAIRNAAIDGRRRSAVFRRAVEARVEIDAVAALTRSDRDEQQHDVERLLDALEILPDPQREVLLLRTRGGLTFAQIGFVLDQSPNTVASHHRRALATLRTLLAGDSPDA